MAYLISKYKQKKQEIGSEGIVYDTVKITDKNTISSLKNTINNSEGYTDEYATDFLDDCPILYVYQTDGSKISIIAEDSDNENIIGVWTKQDASDKKLYKVDIPLAKRLMEIYESQK